ncbi:MAG: hypothetical protein WD200_00710 [Candidatus Andersenbacteria bacterium]
MNQSYAIPKLLSLPLTHSLLAALLIIEILGAAKLLPISEKPIWLGVLATNIGAWAFIGLVRWRQYQARDVWLTSWAAGLIVALVYFDAWGNMLDIYDQHRWFDVAVHTSSGFVGTAVMWQILHAFGQHYELGMPLWVYGLFALFALTFAGVLVELLEWGADRVYGIQYWLGNQIDTVGDLTANIAGGLVAIAGVYGYWWLRARLQKADS